MIDLLPYGQARKDFADHPVRHGEVPVEHAISLPVPTLRWGLPAFAGFAGPAARVPGRPLRLGTPDRWWALHAQRRRLLGYGLTAALPFADLAPGDAVVDRGGRSLTDLQEDLRLLDELMDLAAGPFFDGTAGDAVLRADLTAVFTLNVTDTVLPWYEALAGDFFTWLTAAAGETP